ncbi:shikimate dehydrogenase [Chloroflexota bacterium]
MLYQEMIPTIFFIGVSTKKSSIMNVFPRWVKILNLNADIVGVDIPIHAASENYVSIVRHIKENPLAVGALVTTHKVDLLRATCHLFDQIDQYAEICQEVSCISKREGRLIGHAKDPISSGLTWQEFVEPGHWRNTGGHVLCFGAGGAAAAISIYVALLSSPDDRPEKFVIVNRSQPRLDFIKEMHSKLKTNVQFEYILNSNASRNDNIMSTLPAGSLVINATGMGKDRPGSPITDNGEFPMNGLAWDLNYRGELDFLHQAERQTKNNNIKVEDGWVYFIHGWSQVISEVFKVELTSELLTKLKESAESLPD